MSKPILYFVVGIPASGKSTWAEANKDKLNAVIHSSDEIRTELGDVNDQSQNELVFQTLHKRVKEDLLNEKNVVYDSTGLSRKKRMDFLREIKHISCRKVCVLFATPYEICLKNNANRDRQVPEEIIERMYKSFQIPSYAEGFNEIRIVYWDYAKDGMQFDIYKDLLEWTKFSHSNPHHRLSVGDHMLEAYKHYVKDKGIVDINSVMGNAILMHDCGKIDVRSFLDKDGNVMSTAHYYNHQYVSAYKSLFYLKEKMKPTTSFEYDKILYIALLVELHMRPFLAYNQSKKAELKDRRIFSDDIIDAVMQIHKYDLLAH